MGNVCPCPKRNKKKEFAYDVHQETFEMDENVQNIGEHSPKHEMHDPDNNILTEDLRGSEEATIHASEEKIKVKEQERRADQFQPLSSNQISVQMKNQSEQQSLPLIEHKVQQPVVVVAQQRPIVQSNILKPKTVKKKYNPDDYRYIKQTSSFKVKKLDSIKQQQYNIQDCKDSQYFIFDITANLYIDDCQNCTIFIAPCESTIFIRNCKRMILIAATKQFRTYECHDCVFSLYCKSQPVIESSSNLQFTSFNCPVYEELPKQFAKKRLEPWNNHWSEIHNFTKKEGEKHFSLHEKIPLDVDWERAFQLAELEITNLRNPIPFIVGDLHYESKAEVLILSGKATADERIIELLDGTTILKGFQGVIAGQGKEEKKAILIDAHDCMPERFQEIGRVFTNPSEIETNKGKWFVSFSDEREK